MKSEPRPINVAMLKQAVITKDGYLIYGERCLPARNLLGQKMVKTPSERVAIGEEVAAEIVKRSRQRKDPGLRYHFRTIVAAKAGFDCEATYLLAKRVVEKAVAEVIEKMDSGEITIADAALIACLPQEKQREIANMPRPSRTSHKLRMLRNSELSRRIDEVIMESLAIRRPSTVEIRGEVVTLYRDLVEECNGMLAYEHIHSIVSDRMKKLLGTNPPHALQLTRCDARYVATMRATEDDHKRYIKLLREQIRAQTKRLRTAEAFYAMLKPAFKKHPGITTAKAIALLGPEDKAILMTRDLTITRGRRSPWDTIQPWPGSMSAAGERSSTRSGWQKSAATSTARSTC